MSWRWTRAAGTLTSTCVLCQLIITGRRDGDVTYEQRGHNAMECQRRRAQRRAEAARAAEPIEPERVSGRPSRALPKPERTHCANGHDWIPENIYVNPLGHEKCRVCNRDYQTRKRVALMQEKMARESGGMCCGSVELGVARGRMDSAKTNRPTRERRTVLSTPSATNGKEAVDS